MIIRPETANDYDAIRNLLIAAFADHPYSHQTEHLIVEALRADAALVAPLVAEVDGQVVGHIAFSRDNRRRGLPVVHARASCRAARVSAAGDRHGPGRSGTGGHSRPGPRGCVLVGDPHFYERFGFRSNPALTREHVPPENLLCLPMAEPIPHGPVSHHPAFFV